MVAERIQLRSLKAAPPEWAEREGIHERRYTALGIGKHVGYSDPRHIGPRPDAEPADDLPTLTPGLSTLPTACPHCTSRFLTTEPPLGQHQRGMVTCGRCSRQVCWLSAPLAMPRPIAVPAPKPATAPLMPVRHEPLRPVVQGRFNRTEGCSHGCTVLYGHDPASHESHGRQRVLAEIAARPVGVVRTGPLTVDCEALRVSLDGREIALTQVEMKLLIYLAVRLDRVCPLPEIAESVWGQETAEGWAVPRRNGAFHPPRVHLTRLRGKLGDARRLLVNRFGIGYCLIREEPA